jgi:hypothetical protein
MIPLCVLPRTTVTISQSQLNAQPHWKVSLPVIVMTLGHDISSWGDLI